MNFQSSNTNQNEIKYISSGGDHRNQNVKLNNDLPGSNGEISLGGTKQISPVIFSFKETANNLNLSNDR